MTVSERQMESARKPLTPAEKKEGFAVTSKAQKLDQLETAELLAAFAAASKKYGLFNPS